jgi:hypothetical protein
VSDEESFERLADQKATGIRAALDQHVAEAREKNQSMAVFTYAERIDRGFRADVEIDEIKHFADFVVSRVLFGYQNQGYRTGTLAREMRDPTHQPAIIRRSNAPLLDDNPDLVNRLSIQRDAALLPGLYENILSLHWGNLPW